MSETKDFIYSNKKRSYLSLRRMVLKELCFLVAISVSFLSWQLSCRRLKDSVLRVSELCLAFHTCRCQSESATRATGLWNSSNAIFLVCNMEKITSSTSQHELLSIEVWYTTIDVRSVYMKICYHCLFYHTITRVYTDIKLSFQISLTCFTVQNVSYKCVWWSYTWRFAII